MNRPSERPLFADLRDELGWLGDELRETVKARWELARLELQADLRAAKRLAVVWLASAVMALTALPLVAVGAAEMLNGCGGLHRGDWLLIFAGGLLILALAGGYFAWRRFRRQFIGLRETIEELREDVVWLREARETKPNQEEA